MNENDKVELNLEIIAANATDDDLDRLTRHLLPELGDPLVSANKGQQKG